ncbi:MAG: bifunctional folylpolyglutamate synthase/dihydrofolate synthase [Phycisphaerales bacterium]
MPRDTRRRRAGSTIVEITTYPTAVRYLLERTSVEHMRRISMKDHPFKLERMTALLDAIGNPQAATSMIHVAGTVGKGSTVAMTAGMLRGCGLVVGSYTSPHVEDIRERITINNECISCDDFQDLATQLSVAVPPLDFEPSFFELITAMAFQHFAVQAVDIAVIETGLGGRLDCTNVITPELVLFTTIDIDHTHLLGSTVAEIAREKAGIMKPGVTAISTVQHPEVTEVLRAEAARIGAPLKMLEEDIDFSYRFGSSDGRRPHAQVSLTTQTSCFEHVPSPLPGEHQALNCGLALAAVDHLRGRGQKFDDLAMLAGLERVTLPGRLELVWEEPRILADGAHNAAALASLVRSLGTQITYDSMICIFGCCEDKDIPAMFDQIAMGADKMIFTRARGNARAADPEELTQRFADRTGKDAQHAPNIEAALHLAIKSAQRGDLICVTGSFYLIGDLKKFLATKVATTPTTTATTTITTTP